MPTHSTRGSAKRAVGQAARSPNEVWVSHPIVAILANRGDFLAFFRAGPYSEGMPIEKLPPSVAISPQLTDDRIRKIAKIIALGRAEKLRDRRPQDVSWNLSCDGHIWSWYALRQAAEGEDADWLHVPGKHGDLDICFFIGGQDGVPAKFYSSESPGQPGRTCRPGDAEWNALIGQSDLFPDDVLSLAKTDAIATQPAVIRFALTYGADLAVVSVNLQTIDIDGNVVYDYPIVLDNTSILPFIEIGREQPVMLGEIEVELVDETAARKELERLETERVEREAAERDRKINDKKKGA